MTVTESTNKTVVLVITSLAHFFMSFMGSGINIALPTISEELRVDAILLSWIVTAYMLITAIFLVPFGRISDMVGIKKIFIYGMLIYTAASALSSVSVSGEMLLAFRTLQGVGAAMIMGNTVAIVTSVFSAKERGQALGINVAAVYSGLSLGPFFGGLLTEHLGWRSIFIVNVPAGLIVILFTLWKIKGDWSESKGERFDFIGSVIYGLAITAVMCGFSLLPSLPGALLILAGLLGLTIFVKWENRVASPVLDVSLFKNNRVFAFSNLAALFCYIGTFATFFLLSLYLQYIQGLSPQIAGLIMVSQPVVQAALSPFAGKLSDRVEPRIVSSIGMALTSLGLLLLSFLSNNTHLVEIVVFLVILGSGFALFASPNTNAIMSSVTHRFYGVAAATINTVRVTGQMLSMGITMLLFAIYIGPAIITPEYYPAFLTSTKIAFAIAAAMCFGGIFASLARGNIRTVSDTHGALMNEAGQAEKKE